MATTTLGGPGARYQRHPRFSPAARQGCRRAVRPLVLRRLREQPAGATRARTAGQTAPLLARVMRASTRL